MRRASIINVDVCENVTQVRLAIGKSRDIVRELRPTFLNHLSIYQQVLPTN